MNGNIFGEIDLNINEIKSAVLLVFQPIPSIQSIYLSFIIFSNQSNFRASHEFRLFFLQWNVVAFYFILIRVILLIGITHVMNEIVAQKCVSFLECHCKQLKMEFSSFLKLHHALNIIHKNQSWLSHFSSHSRFGHCKRILHFEFKALPTRWSDVIRAAKKNISTFVTFSFKMRPKNVPPKMTTATVCGVNTIPITTCIVSFFLLFCITIWIIMRSTLNAFFCHNEPMGKRMSILSSSFYIVFWSEEKICQRWAVIYCINLNVISS